MKGLYIPVLRTNSTPAEMVFLKLHSIKYAHSRGLPFTRHHSYSSYLWPSVACPLGWSPAAWWFLRKWVVALDSCANNLVEACRYEQDILIMFTYSFPFQALDSNSLCSAFMNQLTLLLVQDRQWKVDMGVRLHMRVYLPIFQVLLPCLMALLGTSRNKCYRVDEVFGSRLRNAMKI